MGRVKGLVPVGKPVGPWGKVPLEIGYGTPVGVYAATEVERAKMLASVVMTVNGAIAMGMDWVAGAFWIGRWRRKTGRGCSVGY